MENTYLVYMRPRDDKITDVTRVEAFKVEAWKTDYAFFGNHEDLAEVTCLIPRELVAQVEADPGPHMLSAAMAFQAAVDGYAEGSGRNLRSVVSSSRKVWIEERREQEWYRSRQVERDFYAADASKLVKELMSEEEWTLLENFKK